MEERKNTLTGYGLVVGLSGTGDRRSQIAQEKLQTILAYYQSEVEQPELITRNIAAVLVTATLNGFQQQGDTMEAQVASVGDATSLENGYLILTPLKAPNGISYATASGPLFVSGKQNRGSIVEGAVLERSLEKNHSPSSSNLLRYRFKNQSLPYKKVIVEQVQRKFSTWNIQENNRGILTIQKEKATFTAAEENTLLNLPITLLIRPRVIVDTQTRVVVSGGNLTLPTFHLSFPTPADNITWERYRLRRPAPASEKIISFTTIAQLMAYLNQKEASLEEITAVFTTLKRMPQIPVEIIFY